MVFWKMIHVVTLARGGSIRVYCLGSRIFGMFTMGQGPRVGKLLKIPFSRKC